MTKEVIQDIDGYTTSLGETLDSKVDGKQNKIARSDIWQFLRFCIVGSLNAIIDFVVLDLLLWTYPTTDTKKILIYNSLAVLLASTNSFFCNKYWTFRQRQPTTLKEVARFVVIASATTIMNDLLMLFLSIVFPDIMRSALIGANVLKLGAIIGTMSISFFGMRLWVFFQRNHDKGLEEQKVPNEQVTLMRQVSDSTTLKVRTQRTMRTLIIIPTYNERENLPLLLNDIFKYAPRTDVLIVDDNSPDGTGHLAEEMRRQDARIRVMHRAGKLGLGTAYIAGFKYAIAKNYDAAFEMDADFSHDPRHLPDLLMAVQNADLVIGSRYITGGSTPGWSATRRLISGCGNIFARFMLGIPVHDCTGGYRCYRRRVLQSIDLDAIQSRGYAFQVELTYRVLKQNFKIVETPITFMDRRLGTSKMSRKIVIEAFTYVLRTRFSDQSSLSKPVLQEEQSIPKNEAGGQMISPLTLPVTSLPFLLPGTSPQELDDPLRPRIRPVTLRRLRQS